MITSISTKPGSAPRTLVCLSPREIDVVRLCRDGQRPAAIACELGLSEKTVGDYIFRLCQGLQLRGRHELIIWICQNPAALAGMPAPAGIRPWDHVERKVA